VPFSITASAIPTLPLQKITSVIQERMAKIINHYKTYQPLDLILEGINGYNWLVLLNFLLKKDSLKVQSW
jgi:hypothetical protein